MKYFIVSDIHSFYKPFIEALDSAGFSLENPNHTLVVLGDLLDRGPDAIKCLQYVNAAPRKILVRGNHEDLLEEVLAREDFKSYDYSNGTVSTVFQLSNIEILLDVKTIFSDVLHNIHLQTYLNSLVDYYELKNSIFVHGWIPCELEKSSKSKLESYRLSPSINWRTGEWMKARIINGMDAWRQGVVVPNKTIYCGHWHTSWGHHFLHNCSPEWPSYSLDEAAALSEVNFAPFIDKGIVAIDACTVISKKVNCVVIEDEELS